MYNYQKTILREPKEDDLTNYVKLRNNVDLQRELMSRVRPNSIEKVKKWLFDKNSNDNGMLFTIANSLNDKFVGYIQITNIVLLNGYCSIGIYIEDEHRGQGHASNALSIIEKYLKEVFSIKKIVLEVLAENIHAISLYKKNNYREVGCLKEHFYNNSMYSDVLIMEKLIR